MNKLFVPQKFKLVYKKLKDKPISILDIGCGNNSPAIAKQWFPKCTYSGVDKAIFYNDSELDLSQVDHYYEIDLEKETLDAIPDNAFDLIIMTHVIEHLFNGDKVMEALVKKLKPDGYFYIECPTFRSVHLPSMEGTLNFFDDPTHVRLYSSIELYNLFLRQNCKIIKGGTRRNWLYIFLTPPRMLWDFIRYRHVKASVVWDIMGFVEFILVQKK
jgi:2-polyprenyl-3-methyl-5-hydroxy-6-metoxy-1,4-benzoquinol methylase